MIRERTVLPVVRKYRIGEEPSDVGFWLSQSASARLSAVEEIRREHHGWKHGAEPRLQRVFSVVER